jgi:hypothetical protein
MVTVTMPALMGAERAGKPIDAQLVLGCARERGHRHQQRKCDYRRLNDPDHRSTFTQKWYTSSIRAR